VAYANTHMRAQLESGITDSANFEN